MSITITTLVENSAATSSVIGEWGQSLFIEAYGMTILMDTGAGIAILSNSKKLDIDFQRIDKIVLSHGHYDHTGGLQEVLQKINRPVDIIAHPDSLADKYYYISDTINHVIGTPFSRKDIESLGASFQFATVPVMLHENILTTGEVPMVNTYERIDPHLYVQQNGKFLPDKLLDDLSLILKTEAGLVVLLGCAHRGMINILNHAKKLTGIDEIYAVIGGTHLISANEEQLSATIAALKEMRVRKIGASHCTGLKACARLAHEFGDIFFFNNAGTRTVLSTNKNNSEN